MERDLEVEEDMIAEEEYFWQENVQKKVEPEYTEKPSLVLESIRKHLKRLSPKTGKPQGLC